MTDNTVVTLDVNAKPQQNHEQRKRGRPAAQKAPVDNAPPPTDADADANADAPPKLPKKSVGIIDKHLRDLALGELVAIKGTLIPPMESVFRAIKPTDTTSGIVVEIKQNQFQKPTAIMSSHYVWAQNLQFHLEKYAFDDASFLNVGMLKTQKTTEGLARGKFASISEFPPTYGFASDNWLCFNRLGFDPFCDHKSLFRSGPNNTDWHFACDVNAMSDEEKRSLIYGIFADNIVMVDAISRMDINWWPFLARLGSMFFPMASRKQLTWLYGDTNAGKSTFMSAILTALLGSEASTDRGAWKPMEEEAFDDPFWTADIVGLRAVVFSEVAPSFLSHKKMLGMLGEKSRRARRKNADSVTIDQQVMVFCHSNPPPMTEDKEELAARLIAVRMKGISESNMVDESVIFRILSQNAPMIAAVCIAIFNARGKVGGPISADLSTFRSGADKIHDEDIALFEKCFSLVPKRFVSSSDIKQILVDHGYKTREERQKWKDYIARKYDGVDFDAREDRVIGGVSRIRGASGIRIKGRN